MASNKQLEANRANARKSTGPRGQDGKSRSRLNSRKHGLTAKTLIIVGENADDFDQLRAELMDEHDPQSALECELVERLAGILWRLRRVPFFEAAIIDARQAQLDGEARRMISTSPYKTPQDFDGGECGAEKMSDAEWSIYVGHALIRDGLYGDGLGRLARHEAALMNALTKTLQMLLLLQENRENRKGEPVMLEVVALPPAA
jgi:hypothetical protein